MTTLMDLLPEFYLWYEEQYGSQPYTDCKGTLEEFAEWHELREKEKDD